MSDMLSIIKGQTGDRWPRGLGNPFRADFSGQYFVANSAEDVLAFMQQNNYTSVYGTVYSFTEYTNPKLHRDNAIIDCIPFDFDSPDNIDALNESRFVLNWCLRHNIQPRVSFSGSKGFHLIIDFDIVELKHPKETLKRFAEKLITGGNLKCVDNAVLGDINRILRFVDTRHAKTGLFCIPLTYHEVLNFSIDEIRELAKEPRDMVPERRNAPELVRLTILEIDADISKEHKVSRLEGSALQNIWCAGKFSSDKTCRAFEHIKENGVDLGGRDTALCGLVNYFKIKRYSRPQIISEISEINKLFNPPLNMSTLLYKIDYHLRNNYSYCAFFKESCGSICAQCSRNKA
ncbi:hypothetical protein [Bacteroides sp.]|uniref:hypothetical protein n=1 Tax=Bacteroides sp. TaxID=29523 RepID=UPI00262EE72D|nr:hypothetical protein [Bacteroides sp.]MDD3039625.1 hypothetical protein [Bacteroides sp.]